LDTIANIFEEVVFSPHLVAGQTIKTYTADIRAITMKRMTASYE
jgi:hypothetical protein